MQSQVWVGFCLSLDVFPVLFAGRVLQGMSAGYMALVMPMYLTETLPADIRGRGAGIFQFCLGLGLVVAAGAGGLIALSSGASDSATIEAVCRAGRPPRAAADRERKKRPGIGRFFR